MAPAQREVNDFENFWRMMIRVKQLYSCLLQLILRIQSTRASELFDLALRILATVANFVVFKQAFSSMNHVHTKKRNGLAVEKVKKLIYIFINQRKLDLMGFHDA